MQKFTHIQKKWPHGHAAEGAELQLDNIDYSHDLTKRKKISAEKIATAGILERITHEQWHVYESLRKLTKNINVINLASLLAVLPRMGINAYEISQLELAEKMSRHFDMPFVPSRNTISKWEHELQRIGCLEIPRHIDWRNNKTKIRLFTDFFWEISRRGMPKMSHNYPPVTVLTGKVERVEQFNPLSQNNPKESVTKKRARETNNGMDDSCHRAKSDLKKFSRPPKNKKSKIRKLSRFENSVMWWMFQASALPSYRDGVILFAKFLRICSHDDYCQQLERHWRECTDALRPGLIRELITYLSDLSTSDPDAPAPMQSATPILSQTRQQEMLRAALFFDCEPQPQWLELVTRFRISGSEDQEKILKDLTLKGYL